MPWKFFLGPPPRSLAGGIKLLAYNLGWYLREPRTLIRPQWITYGATVVFVPLVLLATIINPLASTSALGPSQVMPWLFGLLFEEMRRRFRACSVIPGADDVEVVPSLLWPVLSPVAAILNRRLYRRDIVSRLPVAQAP